MEICDFYKKELRISLIRFQWFPKNGNLFWNKEKMKKKCFKTSFEINLYVN